VNKTSFPLTLSKVPSEDRSQSDYRRAGLSISMVHVTIKKKEFYTKYMY
jgi:hypothetical protein